MSDPGSPDPDLGMIPPSPGSDVGPPAEQLVGITTERIERAGRAALVVAVTGEIDLSTVERFRAAIADGLDRMGTETPDGAPLVIDLTHVTFLGSPGLAALVEVTRAAQHRREPLRIVVDHTRPVIRPIEMTGLDDLLALHHTLDQALHSVPEGA